jgi:hypothetical protein
VASSCPLRVEGSSDWVVRVPCLSRSREELRWSQSGTVLDWTSLVVRLRSTQGCILFLLFMNHGFTPWSWLDPARWILINLSDPALRLILRCPPVSWVRCDISVISHSLVVLLVSLVWLQLLKGFGPDVEILLLILRRRESRVRVHGPSQVGFIVLVELRDVGHRWVDGCVHPRLLLLLLLLGRFLSEIVSAFLDDPALLSVLVDPRADSFRLLS